MATILKLRVTLDKYYLKDSYFPDIYPTFNIYAGQYVEFDDYNDELRVKVPGSSETRRVKMSKAEVETFTEYV
jgi:hypothetical protein